MSRFASTDCR